MKCKDCFWFSDVAVECCERDGSDPCNPDSDACSAFEEDETETQDRKMFMPAVHRCIRIILRFIIRHKLLLKFFEQ